MSRNIVLKGAQRIENTNDQSPDNYASQIVKLIPVEIVGVYLGLSNIFAVAVNNSAQTGGTADANEAAAAAAAAPQIVFWAQLISFLVVLVLTPIYLKRAAKIEDGKQRSVALISFIIWSISLGGPFEYILTNYLQFYWYPATTIGSALIMVYTLIVPMIYQAAASNTVPTPAGPPPGGGGNPFNPDNPPGNNGEPEARVITAPEKIH